VSTATFSGAEPARFQESIYTITVAGAITTSTRLVGTVFPTTTKDAKVMFQRLMRHALW